MKKKPIKVIFVTILLIIAILTILLVIADRPFQDVSEIITDEEYLVYDACIDSFTNEYKQSSPSKTEGLVVIWPYINNSIRSRLVGAPGDTESLNIFEKFNILINLYKRKILCPEYADLEKKASSSAKLVLCEKFKIKYEYRVSMKIIQNEYTFPEIMFSRAGFNNKNDFAIVHLCVWGTDYLFYVKKSNSVWKEYNIEQLNPGP